MSRIAQSEVIDPKRLSRAEHARLVDDLYAVHCGIFDGVERDGFVRYVVDSKAEETKILVHRAADGAAVGYLALHFFEKRLAGKPATIVRGETGLLRAYRGQGSNVRWVLSWLVQRMRKRRQPLYVFACPVHPASYMAFCRYGKSTWPSHAAAAPREVVAMLETLADEFHLERIPGRDARCLARVVGWITKESDAERDYWRGTAKPAARFYLEHNPTYGDGHGLLTLAHVSPSALTSAAAELARGRAQSLLQAAVTRAQGTPLGPLLLSPATLRRRLTAIPLFAKLDARALDALVKQAEVTTYASGRTVFRQGDLDNDIYFLERGAVYVLSDAGEGDEDIIDQLDGGAVFGEIAALTGGRRTLTIRTATRSTLIRVPGSAVRAELDADPALRDAVLGPFAFRIFDDHARTMPRYENLTRGERSALVARGRREVVGAGGAVAASAGTVLIVVEGALMLELASGATIRLSAPSIVEASGAERILATTRSTIHYVPQA